MVRGCWTEPARVGRRLAVGAQAAARAALKLSGRFLAVGVGVTLTGAAKQTQEVTVTFVPKLLRGWPRYVAASAQFGRWMSAMGAR
jgi:flagellar biosynthesis protein FliQ